MTEKIISSVHIQKLGHNIQEIRERALNNIISKLERGFDYDNDLARTKELLQKLFQWFLFESCSCEEVVLTLIKRILQTESGISLLKHYGSKFILTELDQIKTYIEPKYHSTIEEIKVFTKHCCVNETLVPPLECDVPLSYRSSCNSYSLQKSSHVGTTATSIEGYIYHCSSIDQQTGVPSKNINLTEPGDSNKPSCGSTNSVELSYCNFCWQYLVLPDRHVLESVENSLQNLQQTSTLLHSCEFFIDIMIHDFPPEVFLQRPGIVLLFQKLLTSASSSRVRTAVLSCLLKLTNLLETRINYYSDPCMHNLKQMSAMQIHSDLSSPNSENISLETHNFLNEKSAYSNENTENERPEDTKLLKSRQMSLPYYCLSTIKYIVDYLTIKPESLQENVNKGKNQSGTNIALVLFDKLICLLSFCIGSEIWENSDHQEIATNFNDLLIKLGDLLENLRCEVMSTDFETTNRLTHLHLLHSCSNLLHTFIPFDQADVILPKNFKNALSSNLLDFTFSRLYPGTHDKLDQFVQKFGGRNEKDVVLKYKQVDAICKSMTSTIKFLRRYKSVPIMDAIKLISESLPSIAFHKNLSIIKMFVEWFANKLFMHSPNDDVLQKVEEISLHLFTHDVLDVRIEMYKVCQTSVVTAVGPKMNALKSSAPGSQVLFLLRSQIFIELILHGLTSDIDEIRQYSEDILIHLLKCKILVSDDIWNSVVEALLPSLPILLCHANKNSSLGKTIMAILDPDKAMSLHIATTEVFKGNACLLFTKDSTLHEEAVSRLCWLLTSQDNKNLLPRIINLQDKALSFVCQLKHLFDLNKTRNSEQFYQPSSLCQVLELLNSDDVEPVIRRSALTQISVMMEDHLMHKIFIENGGVQIIMNVMKNALNESIFKDYPDSIIPAVSIIKNLCLYIPSIRQELSNNLELYYWILRGLFLYCTEERMKQEGSILLFLLLFSNFTKGTPFRSDLAIPELLIQRLCIPFICRIQSTHAPNNSADAIMQDKWCLHSIQIHWNVEWFCGFEKVLNWNKISYNDEEMNKFPEYLRLSNINLIALQNSCIQYFVNKHLQNIQNATNHDVVIDSIGKLTGYINLYKAIKSNFVFKNEILSLLWEKTFMRFLNVLPSSHEDTDLLTCILKFLNVLVPLYKYSESNCWISRYLKEENLLVNFLRADYSYESQTKVLNQELLNLITTCVCNEQHYLDFHTFELNERISLNWSHIIELIAENLKFGETQHFYNLAYLDSLLSCLVHLTATLDWSNSKAGVPPKTLLVHLVTNLCEMIGAFHCGKGTSAAASLMGISITRHAILILNHLLVEMQQSNVKDWEICFIEEESGVANTIQNLAALASSRDVILRAAVFQLFSGLALSNRGAIELVQEIECKGISIWETSVKILLEHEESNIVRENVTNMLVNFMSHTTTTSVGLMIDVGVANKLSIKDLMNLLQDLNFYKEVEIILSCLHTSSTFHFKENDYFQLQKGNGQAISFLKKGCKNGLQWIVVTPSLITAVSNFLNNLMIVAPVELLSCLQEHGLIKTFFRSLRIPELDLHNTKDLALYCDILEMNTAICYMLNKSISNNPICLEIILHTRDCLNLLLSLLNPSIYYTQLSQLVYLRNKLWAEICCLLETILDNGSRNLNDVTSTLKCGNAFSILYSTLDECGQGPFLQTLCEAISNNNCIVLQQCALNLLTSFLRTEANNEYFKDEPVRSFQNLLDNTRTSVLTSTEENLNIENIPDKKCNLTNPTKIVRNVEKNIFEDMYFKKIFYKTDLNVHAENKKESTLNAPEILTVGAELCKILLNLLQIVNVQNTSHNSKKKSIVLNALTSILCVSYEAKKYALQNGLLEIIMQQLREFYLQLSMENIESLRRVTDKKRLGLLLKEINCLFGLLTNFMLKDINVKNLASVLGLADLTHKMWVWLCTQRIILSDVLRMLCTYTTDCLTACQSLSLTNSVAGSGPRKTPSNLSLLHAIITLISKEMDQVTRTHDLFMLEYCFHILHHICSSTECRIIVSKSNLLHCLSRLHPAITKRQKPWENVELIWIKFLQTFTCFPEGQACAAKTSDILELIITLTNSTKLANREAAMIVLRNISFYYSNRPKLLTSDDFLNVLEYKLTSGSIEEKNIVVAIMWSLCANNQKAKLVLKCAKLDVKLQETLKILHLSPDYNVNPDDFERMHYVLNLLKEDGKR